MNRSTMASELYSLCWDNFHQNMSSAMHSLLETGDLVDVTIAVEGRHLKAHKMVLSVCSPYFRELFKLTPCKHPIVFLKDVSYTTMTDLLQFMYQGEVQVSQEHLSSFIKTAEALHIKGLTGDGKSSTECGKKVQGERIIVEPELLKPRYLERQNQYSRSSSPVGKKPRFEEPSVYKTKSVAQGVADQQLMLFKMEPEEHSLDTVDDDTLDESFIDDPLEMMMESGDDDPQAGTSNDGIDSVAVTVIPEKSKEKYEQVYTKFEEWYQEKEQKEISESVVLAYFQEKAKTQKSSTLWCYYSMLRSMLFIKKGIDIRNYPSLMAFLKCLPKYKARKSKMFTKQDIDTFLTEADDKTYLMMKIVLILGIAGACGREELTHLLTDNIRDEGDYIQVVVPSRKIAVEREFILTDGNIKGFSLLEMFRKYMNLRSPKTDHRRFFVNYKNGKCTVQPVGKNTIGIIPSKIAAFLGLENPRLYTTHAFRKASPFLLINYGRRML